LSFKDFAASIIRDLIAIQMKYQAMALFQMALKSLGLPVGGGGGGGWFNDVYMAQPRATGGPVSANNTYMVGERGPELFVPRNAGTIVPNHRLSDAMGGGGPSVTYNGPYIANMNAIDTQSSVQFLAKNKQAVWAANQSAQRSLPVSR
jgi:phage-related minor tail protein